MMVEVRHGKLYARKYFIKSLSNGDAFVEEFKPKSLVLRKHLGER
jgi:hypothetical protein